MDSFGALRTQLLKTDHVFKKKANRHIGPSLEDFLWEEGILEEARAVAIKEAVAFSGAEGDANGKDQ